MWLIKILLVYLGVRYIMDLLGERAASRAHPPAEADFIETTMGAFAKFAKADGRVSEQEIEAVEEIIASWTLGEQAAQRARDAFRAAKDDARSFEDYIKSASSFRGSVRYIFLDCIVALSCAEVSGLEAKVGMLAYAARTLGFPYDMLRAMITKHSRANYFHGAEGYGDWRRERDARGGTDGARRQSADSLDADYALLGAAPSASDAELKKAYRKKAMELHPDRLQSQGLPPQMVKVAADNLARINTAYDRICDARKHT